MKKVSVRGYVRKKAPAPPRDEAGKFKKKTKKTKAKGQQRLF